MIRIAAIVALVLLAVFILAAWFCAARACARCLVALADGVGCVVRRAGDGLVSLAGDDPASGDVFALPFGEVPCIPDDVQ